MRITPYGAGPQPGGREPAPGELALVQAFLNTHFDLASGGGEMLASPEALRAWLSERRAARQRTAGSTDAASIASSAVREGIRALAFANNDQDLNAGAVERHAGGVPRGDDRDPGRIRRSAIRHRQPPGTWRPRIGALLAIVARAMIDGSWERLKACPGRHCGWAFYDRSRNQSARWCAMKVCGDREKARAYYERRTGEPSCACDYARV